MTVPTEIPSQLIAGDTWQWTRDLADYPAGTATVYFQGAGGVFNAVGSASGTTHSFTIAAATTAGYASGQYRWRLRVVSGGVVTTAEEGTVEVQENSASTTAKDVRSWAARTLAAVEAFLEGNASTAQASMTIGGRSITRWSLKELSEWQEKLRAKVAAEASKSQSGRGRNIKASYVRP